MRDGSGDSSLELGSLDLAKRSASDLPADNSRGWGTLRLPYSIAPSEVAQGVKGCQRKHLFKSVHLGVRCRSAQVHYRSNKDSLPLFSKFCRPSAFANLL
jgi:hypothetical protein